MALSRFSVLPDQRIVNTHVAQDLSLVNKVLSAKQGAYDEAQAFDQQSEGTFAKHQVRNADIGRRDQLHDEYQQKAQDLVGTKYQGDYGAAMPELRKLANSYAGNEFWNRSSSALDREKEDYKLREQLRKEGKNVLDFAPGMSQKAIYNKDGSYNDISYNTQGQSDWMKARKEAIGKIEASGGSGRLNAASVAGLLQHIDSEGVGASDVQRVALSNFRGYLNGSEGQQEYNYLRAQGRSDKDSQKEVLNNLIGSGSNQIHSKSKTDYLGLPGYEESLRAKAKQQEENATDFGDLPLENNPHAPQGVEWNAAGTAPTSIKKDYGGLNGLGEAFENRMAKPGALGPIELGLAAKDWIAGGKEAPSQQQSTFFKANAAAAKRNGITPKAMYDKLSTGFNDGVQRYTDAKQVKAESEMFFNSSSKSGNFTTRKAYTSEHPDGVLLQDLFPKGLSELNGFSVIGNTTPTNSFTPKGKVLQGMDKDNNPMTLVISDSKNANPREQYDWNVAQGAKRGENTFKTRVVPNGRGDFKILKNPITAHSIAVIQPDGSIAPEVTYSE